MVLETISSLKVPAKIREYRKSDVIFDEGTTGVEMFIVYSGKRPALDEGARPRDHPGHHRIRASSSGRWP